MFDKFPLKDMQFVGHEFETSTGLCFFIYFLTFYLLSYLK